MNIPSNEDIISALKSVEDPEMHIDIYSLGLIYNISTTDDGVDILMTLTTPFCPYADQIVHAVEDAIKNLGVKVQVNITFEPQWEAPNDIRIALGV